MENTSEEKSERLFTADTMAQLKPGESRELVIRKGEAEPINLPLQVNVSGTLSAPQDFFKVRKSLHDPNKCYVVFSRDKMSIDLRVDEQSKYGHCIKGRLQYNPDMESFHINDSTTRTVKQLLELVRKNRYFFPDKEEHVGLVSKLQNFQATIQKTVEESDDMRGASNKQIKIAVEHKIQTDFKLSLPIFKGTQERSFRVQIFLDATDGGILLWLESPELRELELQERDALIEANISEFRTAGLVVIEQ